MVSMVIWLFERCIQPLVGFDEGSPDGHDPLQLVREMASRGITLVRLITV